MANYNQLDTALNFRDWKVRQLSCGKTRYRDYDWRGKIDRKTITVPTTQAAPVSRHKSRPFAERVQYRLDLAALDSLPVLAPFRK